MPLLPLRLPRLGDDRLATLASAGDERAFEALYDRHHRALLGFCRHMLGNREEAEDALQQTYLRAHRALVARGAPGDLRPWLYTIARNCCLTMLSARKPTVDGDETVLASTEGLGDEVQTRADLRAVLGDVERLPEDQRAALVLAELADLSHEQIAGVIGVRTGKVKGLIHQARTTLIAERDAREASCTSIREELATARGGALRRGPLRRHLRQCEGCRGYRSAVDDQRRALALVLPVAPSLGLKAAILGGASAAGGAGAATVGGMTGGFAAKLAVGALVLGGGAGGGAALLKQSDPAPRPAPATAKRAPAQASATPPPTLEATLPVVLSGGEPPRGEHRSRRAARRSGPSERAAVRAHTVPGDAERHARVEVPETVVPEVVERLKPGKPLEVAKPKRVKPAKPLQAADPAAPVKRPRPAVPVRTAKPPRAVNPRKAVTLPEAAKPHKPVKAVTPAKQHAPVPADNPTEP
jgi:RNA polymerase sigma factor (sigma-70 family)